MSLASRIDEILRSRATSLALRTDSEELDFAALHARALRWAQVLDRHRIPAGERVGLMLDNSADFVTCYLAHLLTGRVTWPMNPAYREAEITAMLAVARPRLVVVERRLESIWRAILRDLDDPPTLLVRNGSESYDLARHGAPSPDAIVASPDDALAALVFTSGTTGRPKAAMLTHGMMAASIDALRDTWRLMPDDHLLLALPLFHVHGLCVGVNGMLATGHAITLLPRFDATDIARQLSYPLFTPTIFYGVPTFYARLLEETPRDTRFDHVRLFVSGSAPLAAEMKERFRARFGQRILERYGMTETLMNVSQTIDSERRAGSVGHPLPGVTLRIVDATDRDVPVGDEGEILVRGKNVFPGYFGDPETTAASFTPDGFFHTGDLGRIAKTDGELEITGRAKELIITGGLKVHPREVEECLLAHADVLEAAVAGCADPDLGEAVGALVVLRPGGRATAEDLIAHCRDRLASFKKPRRVSFAESLPKNALGKIVREDVRAALEKIR